MCNLVAGCLQDLEKPGIPFIEFQAWNSKYRMTEVEMKENEIMNKRSGKAWIFLWPDEKEKMYNSNVAI